MSLFRIGLAISMLINATPPSSRRSLILVLVAIALLAYEVSITKAWRQKRPACVAAVTMVCVLYFGVTWWIGPPAEAPPPRLDQIASIVDEKLLKAMSESAKMWGGPHVATSDSEDALTTNRKPTTERGNISKAAGGPEPTTRQGTDISVTPPVKPAQVEVRVAERAETPNAGSQAIGPTTADSRIHSALPPQGIVNAKTAHWQVDLLGSDQAVTTAIGRNPSPIGVPGIINAALTDWQPRSLGLAVLGDATPIGPSISSIGLDGAINAKTTDWQGNWLVRGREIPLLTGQKLKPLEAPYALSANIKPDWQPGALGASVLGITSPIANSPSSLAVSGIVDVRSQIITNWQPGSLGTMGPGIASLTANSPSSSAALGIIDVKQKMTDSERGSLGTMGLGITPPISQNAGWPYSQGVLDATRTGLNPGLFGGKTEK